MYTISKDILKKLDKFEKEITTPRKKLSHSENYLIYKETHKRCQKQYYLRHNQKITCEKCNKDYNELYYNDKHKYLCKGKK